MGAASLVHSLANNLINHKENRQMNRKWNLGIFKYTFRLYSINDRKTSLTILKLKTNMSFNQK